MPLQSKLYPLIVRRSEIDGEGCFASALLPARRKIGELRGERITQREARRRAHIVGQRIAIVETNDGKAIDASRGGNELRYINHSCSPNTYMRISQGRVEFYALRDILTGEEVTCNYGLTHHEGQRLCTCGSVKCQGRI